jgi:spore coat protein CotF
MVEMMGFNTVAATVGLITAAAVVVVTMVAAVEHTTPRVAEVDQRMLLI